MLKKDEDSQGWNCESCNKSVGDEKVGKILAKARQEIELTENNAVGCKVSKLEKLLKKLGKTLHPNHYLCLEVVKSLIKSYGGEEEVGLKRKRELCLELLKILDAIEPGLTRWRG